jgi:hypothetical protein
MFTKNAWAGLACAVLLCGVADAYADDPFVIAQRAVNELYVKPLQLSNAQLKVDAEPFGAECSAAAITIRVLVPSKKGRREVLKVDTVVVRDHLEFVGATGSALHRNSHSADRAMTGTIAFLAQVNGWQIIDEPLRRGAKKGYVERRMRRSRERPGDEQSVAVIVFDETRGVPVVIGTPPPPDFENCGAGT